MNQVDDRLAIGWLTVILLCAVAITGAACARQTDKPVPPNSLYQNTGEAGSALPKSRAPYYPNTSGNIVAPPGNPAGNASGSPPIVGGTENQQGAWPEGR